MRRKDYKSVSELIKELQKYPEDMIVAIPREDPRKNNDRRAYNEIVSIEKRKVLSQNTIFIYFLDINDLTHENVERNKEQIREIIVLSNG